MDVSLLVLKESNKSRFDSTVTRTGCIDHIPEYLSGLSHALISDNLAFLEIAMFVPPQS